jgi:hypothetical protein
MNFTATETKSTKTNPLIMSHKILGVKEAAVEPSLIELFKTAETPDSWKFTPIGNEKKPFLANWQKTPLNKSQICSKYQSDDKFKAIGLLTGENSGGIIAIDHDGASCDRLIEELSGLSVDESLPPTVTFTSGKPGRYQKLYQIPDEFREILRKLTNIKVSTDVTGDDGKQEQVEFRYNGSQSVIMGNHPETGSYKWVEGCDPGSIEVAPCPVWILEYLLNRESGKASKVSGGKATLKVTGSNHALKVTNCDPPWKHLKNLKTFSIPLEMMISKGSKELLEGVGEGLRNDSGTKLIRDLLACEEFLCTHNLEPETSAEEMFEGFCDRCEPPIGDKERETILGSAERKSDLRMSRNDEVIHFEAIWKEIKRQIAHSVYARISWLTGFVEFPENLTEFDAAKTYLALQASYKDYSEKIKDYPNITLEDLQGIAKAEFGKICKLIERGELSYLEVSTLYPGFIFQGVFKKEDSIKYDRASLSGKFGTRLRYNAYKLRQEIDEKPFIDENIEVSLNSDFNFKFSSKGVDRLQGIFDKAARENAYEPIRDYLFSCPKLDSEILNGLADRLFKCGDEPMYNVYLTKWLLALVARALIPGSKVDTVLILKGSQGDFKSSFFRILAGEDNFCDSFGEDLTKDKDELAKLSSNWIIEMPEIEELFRKKDYESFKRFITIQVDKIRLPYARKGIESARRSAFGGTANGDQFLNDPTGSRRFWVIPTGKNLDVKWLREHRDEIWGAVLRLFVEMFPDWETRRNETNPEEYIWWLTPIEQAWSNSSNKSYESTDAWEDTIFIAADSYKVFRVQDIAIHALGIDIKSVDKKIEMRISDVLKRAGYMKSVNPVYNLPPLNQGMSGKVKARWWSKE